MSANDKLARAEKWIAQARSGDPAAYDGPELEAVEALVVTLTAVVDLVRERCYPEGSRRLVIGGTRGASPLLRRGLPVPSAQRASGSRPGHFIGSPAFPDSQLFCSVPGRRRCRGIDKRAEQ